MRRKIIALMLAAACLAALTGCNRLEPLTNPLSITDGNGTEIGKLDNRAGFTVVDGGIFYSVFTLKEGLFVGTADYRFFSLKDQTDYSLGKMENQGYETGFARTELNGVLYTLAVQGNPAGDDPVPLLLLAFDCAKKTMKKYTVSEYGFPYASMTASGGKLLIMNHETSEDKSEKIYEFDPGNETVREVLTFASSEDSLRSVSAADRGFYLLRLKIGQGAENEMFVDRYDENYEKVSERSVNDALVNAISKVRGISGRQDALNEIGMNVSRFYVTDDGCMIYENFGLSRAAINLETGETILAQDDNYSVSTGSGVPVIYKVDFTAENASGPELCRIENGALSRLSFTPDDAHRLVQTVSVSADGTLAILTSDTYPVQNGTGVIHVLPEMKQ